MASSLLRPLASLGESDCFDLNNDESWLRPFQNNLKPISSLESQLFKREEEAD